MANAGWSVEREGAATKVDLMARKGSHQYGIELKSVAEPRPDRVLAVLSQAILQASRHSSEMGIKPMAVISVDLVTESLLKSFERFHKEYAPDVAVGLFSGDGFAMFAGPGLASLNSPPNIRDRPGKWERPSRSSDLFSDLNQWLMKVLLAPEVPEHLIKAPRNTYRSGAELAQAADVSSMSVSRFMRRCDDEGFLKNDGREIRLVRRRELFRRWQAAALRSSPELQMRYLLPGDKARALHKAASRLDACIGLFAAADLLRIGHVSGATPSLYVHRLNPPTTGGWDGLERVRPGELAQVTLKQSGTPQSLFRGAVEVDGVRVSDVLQIWLDVSTHPSRGAEQAALLSETVLRDVMKDRE